MYQIFEVPIGNAKITRKVQFHPAAPVINITKRHLIVFVWFFTSAFHYISENRAITDLVNSIE